MLAAANLTLRFLLELAAIGALGYWGFRTGAGPLGKAALGLGAPALAIVVWGAFVAPKASVDAPEAVRLLLSLAVFGAAAIALAASHESTIAWAFAGAVAINIALLHGFDIG